MKKTVYLSMIILLFLGCKGQKELVSVNTKTDEVTLKKGQSCEIEFITNASTGYWWQLINEEEINVVKSVGDRYTSDAPKGMIGASSHRFWKFEAVEKGTQTLHFVYARANIDEAVRTRDVIVTVK
jgi:predicted secreted protein